MTEESYQFKRHGITWHREWVGDNGGRYEWSSARAVIWREGHFYRLAIDGNVRTDKHRGLLAAMDRTLIELAACVRSGLEANR